MTGRDYRLGKLSLVDRAARIDEERTRKLEVATRGQDKRTGAEYAADLARETERSLRKSRRWLTGHPLGDHRDVCDCPPSLAGCVERQTWHTLGDVPKRPPLVMDKTEIRERAYRRNQRVARVRRKGGRP